MSSGRFVFPLGTLVINVSGSLLLGVLFGLSTKHLAVGGSWLLFAGVGFLGAFTTFSTFSLETMRLLESGSFTLASVNIAASVIASLVAVYIGLLIGRTI